MITLTNPLTSRHPPMLATFQWISVGALFVLYYAPAIAELVNDWYAHSTFSYGFLIPFVAGYLVWQRWAELKSRAIVPNICASVPLLTALAVGFGARVIGDSFAERLSMILGLGSVIWLLFGREVLKALVFPLFFLSLMIPIPYVLVSALTYYLRFLDATSATMVLQLLDIPVYRETYFLHLPNMTLEVADVCSGVSSVFALFAVGTVYVYFLPLRSWLKSLLVACTFPFAVVANLVRIVVTAILAYKFGPVVFQSTFHAFSGTVTFLLALLMVVAVGERLRQKCGKVCPAAPAAPAITTPEMTSKRQLSWSSFSLVCTIFFAAFYAARQVEGGKAAQLRSDLAVLTVPRDYNETASEEDNYKDSSAESSLSRVFSRADGRIIEVFIGYRGEQRGGSRLRSPRLYFPDKWNFVWVKPAELPVSGTTTIHANWMLTRKGESTQLVLYWYQIGNGTYAGEFAYRLKQLRRSVVERLSDGAVIRIAIPLRNGDEMRVLQERLRAFGIHLYPQLVRVLPM
jgi:EpsI family protein